MALKSQCRITFENLAIVKNPPVVSRAKPTSSTTAGGSNAAPREALKSLALLVLEIRSAFHRQSVFQARAAIEPNRTVGRRRFSSARKH